MITPAFLGKDNDFLQNNKKLPKYKKQKVIIFLILTCYRRFDKSQFNFSVFWKNGEFDWGHLIVFPIEVGFIGERIIEDFIRFEVKVDFIFC